MSKIALLVIYNHRYDKNIPIVEELYAGKFSHIYHVIPFYDGDKENVLPVYESSYRFQSYIAQAYRQILQRCRDYTHYFVVADDMLLNPSVNEHNLFDKFNISDKQCFITRYFPIKTSVHPEVFPLLYVPKMRGLETGDMLPDKTTAEKIFNDYGIDTGSLNPGIVFRYAIRCLKKFVCQRHLLHILKFLKACYFLLGNRKLKYPIVWGYSDTLIVTADVMPKFCNYCGIFSATNLFVEFAIPTALLLSGEPRRSEAERGGASGLNKVVTEKQTGIKSIVNISTEIRKIEEKYETNLQNILARYPEDILFIHPIKLSKWK
ncbi:MAG: hypothetical protein LBR51_05900 [Bacteroidales bacterium]|jgi:hypothetical protein|nr:hypothetical protein [Bacteroidales bacterium]